ncbi:MAG: ThuA domain-containing protein [Anaerolineales bacterium]
MTNNVLLVSAGILHPPYFGRLQLHRTLKGMSSYRFERVARLEALTELSLGQFGALVLYFHHQRVSSGALQALDDFTKKGAGVLALHSASASFKGQARYFDLLGGRFVRHGPVGTIHVRPALKEDEIFGQQAPFTVMDELYRHEYAADNRTHFYAEVEGGREPVVWTRTHERGRVCYCSLGHRSATLRNPAMDVILRRGLAWVCEGKSAEAPQT